MSLSDEQKRSIIAKDPRYATVWPDIAKTIGIVFPTIVPTNHQVQQSLEKEYNRVTLSNIKEKCIHLGQYTGETQLCPTCNGGVKVKLFECGVYGKCTITARIGKTACCNGCTSYVRENSKTVTNSSEALQSNGKPLPYCPSLRWEYGVTTVPERLNDNLPRTLDSLLKGGFHKPRLFVDGINGKMQDEYEDRFGIPVTGRKNKVGVHGNWFLGMMELYIRNPNAHMYAMFQDDLVCVRNLRRYLECIKYPGDKLTQYDDYGMAYLNLYTFREENEQVIVGQPRGFVKACELNSGGAAFFYGKRQQAGRSALALVFSRPALETLLRSQHMVERVKDPARGGDGVGRYVDGGIVESMNKANYWEYVHNPSLVQHTGHRSTIGNHYQEEAKTFPGEDFDALDLLPRELFKEPLPALIKP